MFYFQFNTNLARSHGLTGWTPFSNLYSMAILFVCLKLHVIAVNAQGWGAAKVSKNLQETKISWLHNHY